MCLLAENPHMTQRELARGLGISLGGVNYCLKALVEKGWEKVENFSKSDHKLRYPYLSTPKGITGKVRLTNHCLRRELDEYEALKDEIERLRVEANAGNG